MVRKRQLWRVKDCKAVAGEHVTNQHKLVMFMVWMKKGGRLGAGVGRLLGGESAGEMSSLSKRRG